MEYGIINGYNNHLVDVIDFEFNQETTFWFKWFNGSEWIEVKPFTEWALHYDDNSSNLKLLIGHNFDISGEIDLIIYAIVSEVELEIYNGKLTV
jgi:hypothetical protein